MEQQYLSLLREVLATGDKGRQSRIGETTALFALQRRWDLRQGFPAVTTKQLFFKSVIAELIWFLEGSNSNERLKEIMGKKPEDTTIWTKDAEKPSWKPKAKFLGDIGRGYGVQWRSWQGANGVVIDQIALLIEKIKKDPMGRYHVVTAWNPADVDNVALPPCHMFFQCFVADGKISLAMTQRSCDLFLGVPFNIASYAILLSMLAHVTGLVAHELVITFNDAHIYKNHEESVRLQLGREPLSPPKLWLNPEVKEIDKFTLEDVKIIGYEHHPAIREEMNV